MPARERPCLEHVQRCPGLLVAFSLSLVSFKTGATNQKPSLELLRHRPWAHSHRLHVY